MVETLLFHVDKPEYVNPTYYRLALQTGQQDQRPGLKRSAFERICRRTTRVNLIPYSRSGYYVQLVPDSLYAALIDTTSGEIAFPPLEDRSQSLQAIGKWWGPEEHDPLGLYQSDSQTAIPDDTLRRRAALAGATRIAVETLDPKNRRKDIVITF